MFTSNRPRLLALNLALVLGVTACTSFETPAASVQQNPDVAAAPATNTGKRFVLAPLNDGGGGGGDGSGGDSHGDGGN